MLFRRLFLCICNGRTLENLKITNNLSPPRVTNNKYRASQKCTDSLILVWNGGFNPELCHVHGGFNPVMYMGGSILNSVMYIVHLYTTVKNAHAMKRIDGKCLAQKRAGPTSIGDPALPPPRPWENIQLRSQDWTQWDQFG